MTAKEKTTAMKTSTALVEEHEMDFVAPLQCCRETSGRERKAGGEESGGF